MVGFPRSGTTLLEQVLGSHPAVVTSNEKPTLDDATRAFLRTPGDVARLAAMRGAGLKQHRDAYWRRVREHGIAVAGRVFIDKQPYYTLQLPLILRLFPAAKIVFSVRDPRDVVLSCFRRRFLMSAPNFQFLTLDGTARFYDATMRLAEIYRAKLPLELLQLRHEDLVSDFEARVRETCDFLGLTWQDSMRDFASPRQDAVHHDTQFGAGHPGTQSRRDRPLAALSRPDGAGAAHPAAVGRALRLRTGLAAKKRHN